MVVVKGIRGCQQQLGQRNKTKGHRRKTERELGGDDDHVYYYYNNMTVILDPGLPGTRYFLSAKNYDGLFTYGNLVFNLVSDIVHMHKAQMALLLKIIETMLWWRTWQSTPVFSSGESHGQRGLVGYHPWGQKESDTTEQLSTAHRDNGRKSIRP